MYFVLNPDLSWIQSIASLAFHTSLSKAQLRKIEATKPLHAFMVLMEAGGHTTRQEAVSMVPPLFLKVQADFAVLDLCAAPG